MELKMNQLKLSVCLAFILLFSGFELVHSRFASGQSAPETLAPPTGVSASDNQYNSKVGINWETMIGATQYRIFRSTTNDPATAVDIGTTAAGSFFDASATPGQPFFYWVRAE